MEVKWFTWVIAFITLQRALCQCSGSALTISAREVPAKFTSPGYPTAYTNDLTCEWLLDSGVAGQPIVLYSDNYDLDCPLGDFINIYNGATTSDPALAENICGSAAATQLYTSSDRYVLVTFTTNSADVSEGFEMTYLSAADTSGTGCSSEYTLTASSTTQYLTSNSFPSEYSSNSNCRWLISAPGSLSTISVEIVWSEIEDDASCAYDALSIYDGSYICEKTNIIVTECSTRTNPDDATTVYTSASNNALVVLTSDGTVNKYGFVLKYSATILYTTTTTTQASTTAGVTAASAGINSSQTVTETKIDITLTIVSGVSGAGLVLVILAIIRLVKYIKVKKKTKKGVLTVQSIAPLPARPTLFTTRHQANPLSFV